ncbi:MAG: FAD-dependent oxidoreductase, partial [Comamonadaceae bacterium]
MSAAGPAPARILETGFGAGLHFLNTWQAWRNAGARTGLLHYAGITARPLPSEALLQAAAHDVALQPLVQQLAAQWFGLMPGFHRMVFEDGAVLLTLCVGETRAMLRAQEFSADAVWLHDEPADPAEWDLHALKSIARLCRRGAVLSASSAHGGLLPHLASCGFAPPGDQPSSPAGHWSAVFAPGWAPRGPRRDAGPEPGTAVVVGGGLSGAAAANSLARRGWQVQVLDAAPQPAAGASGLPAGLLAPHQSPDDSLLSRLIRAGVRITLQQARALLREGVDWQASGALEHRLDALQSLPPAPDKALAPWSREASSEDKLQARLPAEAPALWHASAAWIKPATLVHAWLDHPRISWRGGSVVARVEST